MFGLPSAFSISPLIDERDRGLKARNTAAQVNSRQWALPENPASRLLISILL
jgi:hypothetical protein